MNLDPLRYPVAATQYAAEQRGNGKKCIGVWHDRFHGTYPPNINEGTQVISRKGPTRFQVVPFVF